MYTLLCHNYYEFIIMSYKQITENTPLENDSCGPIMSHEPDV